jgi:hypothetical protein
MQKKAGRVAQEVEHLQAPGPESWVHPPILQKEGEGEGEEEKGGGEREREEGEKGGDGVQFSPRA